MKHLIDLPKSVKLITFDILGSTNDKAKELAKEGAKDWTVVWSRTQNKGKGRQGKSWVSPLGNLYCSIILRPEIEVERITQLSFVIPLAINEAIKKFLPENADIKVKWPNDVLVNDKKVAGILLESSFASANKINWLAVGIGINITRFPSGIEFPATSLNAEGAEVELEKLLERLILSLKEKLKYFNDNGFAKIRSEWLANAYGLDKRITVKLSNEIVTGTFKDIDDAGFLEVKQENGKIRKISAGEVFFEDFNGLGNVTGN